MMARLMDILLALVKILCGGSTTQEEPPTVEYQKSDVERPPHRQATITRPKQRIAPEHRRQELKLKPLVSRPHADHRPSRQECLLQTISRFPERDLPLKDQNQINQHEDYVALRGKASEHGDLMARCFQEGHEAYGRGDGGRAKELSEKGKQHERTMVSLNAKASAWIFKQNNLDSKPGEIDLHGLYVKEAISYVDKGIQEARQRGDAEIRLIVGKGLHSDGHVAKIKPAIEDLMKKQSIPTEVDPHNPGVLVARLRY